MADSQRRILLVGTGGIGKRHIRGFLATERARLSVVEPDEAKRQDVAGTYPVDQQYTSLDEAPLTEFDAAVICAPAHVHIPLARACAEAGLPFLLEKPLAVTMDGVPGLVELVAARGIEARVGYIRRIGLETAALREALRRGDIGELRLAYVNVSQEYPKYRPDYRQIYYARPEMGGGAVLDAASHIIDLLAWIHGPVAEVGGMYDRLQLTGVEVEDTCLISLRFANGTMAQININQFQKPNVAIIELIGSQGNLRYDGADNSIRLATDDSGEWRTIYTDGQPIMQAHENRFRLQATAFLDALDGKPCPLATLDEARHCLAVALAVKQSWQERRIVKIG